MADRNENQAPEKLQVKFYKTQKSDPLNFHCFFSEFRTKILVYVLKTGEVSSNGCLLYSWSRSSCFLEQYSHYCRLLLPSFSGSVSVSVRNWISNVLFWFSKKIVENVYVVCRIIILQGYYHLYTNPLRLGQSWFLHTTNRKSILENATCLVTFYSQYPRSC